MKGIWTVDNNVLFSDLTAVANFAQYVGCTVANAETLFPARGDVIEGVLVLSSSAVVRLTVDQLEMGIRSPVGAVVCSPMTYSTALRQSH